MKKQLAILMSFLVFATPVMAVNSLGIDAGSLPNHWSYGLKTFGESAVLAFTFNQQKKAELNYAYALRRMAEAEEMDAIGEYQQMNQLMEKYQYRMERVQNYIETAEELGEDMAEIEEQVQTMTQVQTQVLQRLRLSVPEEAQSGIDNALEATSQVRERIRQRLDDCVGECSGSQNVDDSGNGSETGNQSGQQ